MRQNISSGSPWEPMYGYSRAVRVGTMVFVAGTTAGKDDDGKIIGGDDVYHQSVAALKKIEKALQEAGASMSDVVRTRTFMTNIGKFDQVAKAHREFFGEIRPAATLIEVSALVEPGLQVEIEADAIIGEPEVQNPKSKIQN